MRANALVIMIAGGLLAAGAIAELSKDAPASAPMLDPTAPAHRTAEVASLVRAANGHFYAEAFVAAERSGGAQVRFLVDTGASVVALTIDDARRVGIDTDDLSYAAPMQTAAGRTFAAPVRLEQVRVAGVELSDVDAVVLRDGLHASLLGMSFLGRLSRIETEGDALILRR